MTLPPFTRALTRQPATTAPQGITTSAHLGTPDLTKMAGQYAAYLDALRDCGLDVITLPPDDRFPDGHFVEDPVVIFRDMAFISRPGALARRGEGDALAVNLSHLHRVYMAGDEATLDGGDVLFCADRALIGLSERTNAAGAGQLAAALHTIQPDLRVETVAFSGVLHLKTGVTELAPGVLVRSPFMQTSHDFSFAETVILPPAEAYAADVLPVNDALLIPAGFPTVAEVASRHYSRVVALDMTEFEKMDGGLTCLSLRY
jgi:dimethylargininase